MELTGQQLEKYAEVLLWGLETARSGKCGPYDVVLLRYHQEALPLAEVLHRRLVQLKRHVVLRCFPTPAIEKNFYSFSDEKQRKFVNAGEKELYSSLNGNIFLNAPSSLTHLKDIDPRKISQAMVAKKFLREIHDRREEEGKLSWTLCTLPTEELARNARLSIREYAAQIVKACFLDEKDPVSKWRQVHADCLEIKKWLKSLAMEKITLSSASMELEISLGERRRFLGISGHNIPSFEIFTSPDWRGTRGTYYSDFPSFKNGNYVRGIRLVFENGRAVKISAAQGGEFVKKMLAMDEGACRIGEFSLTDRRFSRIDKFMADTLFDENVGGRFGNCHLAVGASYSDTYDGNPRDLTKREKARLGFNDSTLHWDLVNTENKTVTARLRNGKTMVIYEGGIFKY